MRNANRPSGPGKPTNERRDEAITQEELDETIDDQRGTADQDRRDPSPAARQAERDAHTKGQDADSASGTSRDRRG